jgi:predicted Zn-dependent peptidase
MTREMKKTVLSNGLTVVGEPNPANVSAAIGFFVRTGSRDENEQESGVSHFLEHMMFKGTATRSAEDITFQLGNIGAQANAFTSEENTVYYGAVIPEHLPAMQELLSDMLRPAIDPDEFSTEKNVILEEIALYQDRPTHVLFEKAYRTFYGTHPVGNSVLGSTDSISALTYEQMRGYFERRKVRLGSACTRGRQMVRCMEGSGNPEKSAGTPARSRPDNSETGESQPGTRGAH